MSSDQMENQAKTKLAVLVKSIEPIVEQQVADFTPAEVEYVLANFRKFLPSNTFCLFIGSLESFGRSCHLGNSIF
mgnify:CR=1 FL=1